MIVKLWPSPVKNLLKIARQKTGLLVVVGG
jgi:hypothetical protein